ncbi:MAG: cytochrome c3 family protein [Desulfuromonadales bacterium]
MRASKKMVVITVIFSVFTVASCLAAESAGTADSVSGKPCYRCHRSKVTGAYVHEAVAGKECTPCHNAAGGDHQKNHNLYAVKDKSPKLCYECHDSKADKKSVHPAIDEAGCTGCHAPHNSSLQKLLRREVPSICFQCHNLERVELKETGKATGFRDGVQNLHYVHAGEKTAIPCLTCHDVHASNQLHLIRPKGTNGKEAVTITYTADDKGGNCTTSCHDPLGYVRK